VSLPKENISAMIFCKSSTKTYRSDFQIRLPKNLAKMKKKKSPLFDQESALIPLVVDITHKNYDKRNKPRIKI